MNTSRNKQILDLAQQVGVLRARDVARAGIPHSYLSRLTQRGQLQQVGRGLYMLPDAAITEHHTLVEASKRVPDGVICLLSALRFHQLTTHQPFQIWMALENKAWQPQVDVVPLRFVRFSGQAFAEGVDTHILEGTSVKVYNAAKTVADCFKYRNKIGLDLCLEALRTGLRQRKFSVDLLMHYAQICRVENSIKPYIEAMI
jgi:predicted transcriptional regulator of viral defense system